jgi:hypothetical protein
MPLNKIFIFTVNGGESRIGIAAKDIIHAAIYLPQWVTEWDTDVDEAPLMKYVSEGIVFYFGGVG